MQQLVIKDIRRSSQEPTPGKVVTDSNRFGGHEARMASHTHRIWNHPCEREDGSKCPDCIMKRRR